MVLARTSSGAGPGTKYWLEGRAPAHYQSPLSSNGYRSRLCGTGCVCVGGEGEWGCFNLTIIVKKMWKFTRLSFEYEYALTGYSHHLKSVYLMVQLEADKIFLLCLHQILHCKGKLFILICNSIVHKENAQFFTWMYWYMFFFVKTKYLK